MSEASGIREVGYFDCPGGGQVVVDGTTAYVGHMAYPDSTTIVDVSDPKNPKQVARVQCDHEGVHAHKVRVKNGLMLTNYEATSPAGNRPADFRGGLRIFDVSNPAKPELITFWQCDKTGVHRFTFDGRYAYISPEVDGYDGNIVMILDLADPAKPQEVGRWHAPGQWEAGGEKGDWPRRDHRCHHPIRMGDRLYVSYWQGGLYILDISDMSAPEMVSHLDWSPPFACPTHTALPIPFPLMGRNYMLVADEDVMRPEDATPAFVWLVDITDETHPVPVSSYQVAGLDEGSYPPASGCHQPVEDVKGTEIPCAWFAQGMRVIDIANPRTIREVAYYLPDPAPGAKRVASNDVCTDDRSLIYLIDRVRGLNILERT